MATKAYLPVGFKMADFGHLGEGSYCFCTKCRARLFPKRTAAEKAQARLQAQAKLADAALAAEQIDSDLPEVLDETVDETSKENDTKSIHVEELEIVPLELEELSESNTDIEESEEEDV